MIFPPSGSYLEPLPAEAFHRVTTPLRPLGIGSAGNFAELYMNLAANRAQSGNLK